MNREASKQICALMLKIMSTTPRVEWEGVDSVRIDVSKLIRWYDSNKSSVGLDVDRLIADPISLEDCVGYDNFCTDMVSAIRSSE